MKKLVRSKDLVYYGVYDGIDNEYYTASYNLFSIVRIVEFVRWEKGREHAYDKQEVFRAFMPEVEPTPPLY
jgi:hypothetical protein